MRQTRCEYFKVDLMQARPWTFTFYIIFIYTFQKSFNLSSKYYNLIENIIGKRSDLVRKIINIAQKTRQHCRIIMKYTESGHAKSDKELQLMVKHRAANLSYRAALTIFGRDSRSETSPVVRAVLK